MAKQFEFTQDYGNKKKGDVVAFDIEIYHAVQHPLLAKGILKNTEQAVRKEQVKKNELNLDINKDGKIDSEDAKIASKVLAHQKQMKHGGK